MFYYLSLFSFLLLARTKKTYLCSRNHIIRVIMTINTPLEEIPIVRDIDNIERLCGLGNDLKLLAIKGTVLQLPEYFQTAEYALNLHVRGKMTAHINHQEYTIEAPCFSSILINQPIKVVESSDDVVQYILGFSPQFAEDMHLNLSTEAHIRAYMRPVFPLTEPQMRVAMHHFDLLHEILQTPNESNTREVALNLVRSMTYYIYGLYDTSFLDIYSLSHSEELVGRFLALVEHHCREYHSIDWYASELCLTPKYLANLVKQITSRSAGDCIDYNLMSQAKWLLRSTTLSVHEISERLGFQNQSHFGTFFRRHCGVSPSRFRNEG